MIKIIRDIDGFERLQPIWSSLGDQNSKALVFQTFEWNYYAWKQIESDKELFILDVTRDGHPDEHVIFPFCIDAQGRLGFIAAKISDVLDAIYADHENDWHMLYAEVAKFLDENPEVNSIALSKIHGECEIARYFPVYVRDVVLAKMDAHSGMYWEQTDEPTRVMNNLNSKERSYVRSMLKYVGHKIVVVSKSNGDNYPKESIMSMRQWMIDNGWRDQRSLPMAYFDLMEDMYERGLCDVSLAIDKESGACNLTAFRLPLKNRIVFWLVMYNVPKLVTICDAAYIEGKLKESSAYFDWGTGAYAYKLGTFRPNVYNLYRLESKPLTIKQLLQDMKGLLRKYARAWAIKYGLKNDRFHPAICKRKDYAGH